MLTVVRDSRARKEGDSLAWKQCAKSCLTLSCGGDTVCFPQPHSAGGGVNDLDIEYDLAPVFYDELSLAEYEYKWGLIGRCSIQAFRRIGQNLSSP